MPNANRVQAILEMPEPKDKAAIQRFLGMVNYVHKFIPNLSSVAEPLRKVLRKDVLWHWEHEQIAAFKQLKDMLSNAPVLAYYDVKTPITIQVDACKSGLGGAIFQNNKPVAMASKALTSAQENYAIIEKELLAICFGVHRFHEYIFGKEVLVETDHKPLVAIMKKPIHTLSPRMQRMRMRLQNYNIKVTHVKGKLFCRYAVTSPYNTTKPRSVIRQ